MKITKDQFKALRKNSSKGNWKMDIVQYLKEHQGCSPQELYDATRPDKKDSIPLETKQKDLASQFTYLRNAGYMILNEADGVHVATEPVLKDGKPDGFQVLEGYEDRVRSILGI